jgi:cytochrome c6
MKRIAAVVVAVAFAVVAHADEGQTIYSGRCTACHGKDGKGTGVGQKMGAQDLTQSKLSEADVKNVVENGRGKMTAFKGKLSEEQITAVAKYVKSLGK